MSDRARHLKARRTRQQRIDDHLRRWAGVDYAILALDMGVPEDLLRARGAALGLLPGRPEHSRTSAPST